MAKGDLKAAFFAVESSAGSLAADGTVDVSGLSWLSIEATRASVVPTGEQATNPRDEARGSFYALPPEPVTAWDTTARIDHRGPGTITLSQVVRGVGGGGGGISDLSGMPWYAMLASSMADGAEPAAEIDTPAAGVSTTAFTLTSATTIVEGDVFLSKIGGKIQGFLCTDKVTSTGVIHTPAASAGISAATDVRTCRTLFLDQYAGGVGSTFALKLEGHLWRTVYTMCRVADATFKVENGRLMLDLTIQYQHGHDASLDSDVADGTNRASFAPGRTTGPQQHFRGVRCVISAATPAAAPAQSAATEIALDDFTFKISFGLQPVGTSNNIMGASNLEVTMPEVEVTITPADHTLWTTVKADFLTPITGRTLVIPIGPLATADGSGMVFLIPNAVLQTDPKQLDASGPLVKTRPLTYRAGKNIIVDPSASPQPNEKALAYIGAVTYA